MPHHILVRIFMYLPLSDVKNCMTVCTHWHNVLAYEVGGVKAEVFDFLSFTMTFGWDLASRVNDVFVQDSVVWRSLAVRKVPESALSDPHLLSDVLTFKQKLRAFYFAWNPNDTSKWVSLSP